MLIYMLLNTIEERCYVGQTTKSLQARWTEHKAQARGGAITPLHAALRKWDSEDLWERVVLQNCYNLEQLDQAEAAWIQICNALETGVGYNVRPEGFIVATTRRTEMTDDERARYREWGRRGARPRGEMSEEEREKYRAWGRKGAARSKELAGIKKDS